VKQFFLGTYAAVPQASKDDVLNRLQHFFSHRISA
jgi:hypothetical protein